MAPACQCGPHGVDATSRVRACPAEPGARRYRRSTMSHLTAPLGRPHPVRLRPPRRTRPGRRALGVRRRRRRDTRPTRQVRRARRARPRPPRPPARPRPPPRARRTSRPRGAEPDPGRGVRRRHRGRAGRRHRGRRLAVGDGLRARHRPGRRRLRRRSSKSGLPAEVTAAVEDSGRAGIDALRGRRRSTWAASRRAVSRSTPARPASRSSRRCRRAPCSASRR